MVRRNISSLTALVSIIIVISVLGSSFYTILADGQQIPQQQTSGTTAGQVPPKDLSAGSPVLQGLEGLRGFGSGNSQLSLAVIPLSEQDNQMVFQVNGFAVSIPATGEAVIYSMGTPLPGVIDLSQNTLQIDISKLADGIDTAGYTDSSEIYDIMRSDPQVMILDVDLAYAGKQGAQTSFNVNSVDLVPPDGRMTTYSLQQPTQLIVDTQNDIVAMVAFPEMVNSFGNYYDATYTSVEPVVYSEPTYVTAPIVTPYVYPIQFYSAGYAWYNRFYFGNNFQPFWNRDRVTHYDRISNVNLDRFPTREPRNDFADRSRNALQTAQSRGNFAEGRSLGNNVRGGVGGYRGGIKQSPVSGKSIGGGKTGGVRGGGARMGGMKAGGGRGGGGRRR